MDTLDIHLQKEAYRKVTSKWEEKINELMKKKKDLIPEYDVKNFLKENCEEILEDLYLLSSDETREADAVKFIREMINYGKGSQSKVFDDESSPFLLKSKPPGKVCEAPGLDYYDHRRDRGADGELIKYQGSLGKW